MINVTLLLFLLFCFFCCCYYFIFNAVVICYADVASTGTNDPTVEERSAICPCCHCCSFSLIVVWIFYSNVVVCQKNGWYCDVGKISSIIFVFEPLVAMLVGTNQEIGGLICCIVDHRVGCMISLL